MPDDFDFIAENRRDDTKLDEIASSIAALDTKVDDAVANAEKHVDVYHAFKAPELVAMVDEHRTLLVEQASTADRVERIAVILEGEEKMNIAGDVVGFSGGMVERQKDIDGVVRQTARDVEKMKHDANGGRGFSIRNKDKLIIGTIAAIPGIIGAVLVVIALGQGA